MEDIQNPGYYAIIPATVRYDKSLCDGAKMLYGEISSLCNLKGFCWASDSYFAELTGKSDRTINRWIGALKKCGYIFVNYAFKGDSAAVDCRCISIVDAQKGIDKNGENVSTKMAKMGRQKCLGGIDKNGEPYIGEYIRDEDNKRESARARGKYSNICLTDLEYADLTESYGQQDTDKFIEEMSTYLQSTGKTYQDHAATLARWIEREKAKPMSRQNGQVIKTHDYTDAQLNALVDNIDDVDF